MIMKVDFTSKVLGKTVVSFISPWEKQLAFENGNVIACGDKNYKVISVDSIFQGCFGAPKNRMHSLMVEPMGHESVPQVDEEINLFPEV